MNVRYQTKVNIYYQQQLNAHTHTHTHTHTHATNQKAVCRHAVNQACHHAREPMSWRCVWGMRTWFRKSWILFIRMLFSVIWDIEIFKRALSGHTRFYCNQPEQNDDDDVMLMMMMIMLSHKTHSSSSRACSCSSTCCNSWETAFCFWSFSWRRYSASCSAILVLTRICSSSSVAVGRSQIKGITNKC